MIRPPPSALSSPAIRRKSVVLPQPDGPSRVKNSFSWKASETSSTAFTTVEPWANDLLIFSRISASVIDAYHRGFLFPCHSCRGAAAGDRAFSFNDGDGNERVAMGEIAKAIVAIEREQREAKERGYNRLDK